MSSVKPSNVASSVPVAKASKEVTAVADSEYLSILVHE